MTFNIQLSKEVLARRVFNKQVNDMLQQKTILKVLDGYVDKDKISIDVGAATGHITTWLAPRSKEVWAFEPVEPVYEQLTKGHLLSFGNVIPLQVAVSDYESDNAEFFIDHRRLSNSGFQDLVGGPATKVHVYCLDRQFFDDDEINPPTENQIGFIKIDTEGTEFDVIKGAQKIIERDRPNMMIEIYKPFSKYPIETIFEHLMLKHGYRCFYYQHPGLIECKTPAMGVEAVLERHHIHDGDFLFAA